MLLYLVKHLRPDIANATRELSKVMDKPTPTAMKELKRVMKYVINTKTMVCWDASIFVPRVILLLYFYSFFQLIYFLDCKLLLLSFLLECNSSSSPSQILYRRNYSSHSICSSCVTHSIHSLSTL